MRVTFNILKSGQQYARSFLPDKHYIKTKLLEYALKRANGGFNMDFYAQAGQQALFGIMAYIFFIGITFYALQAFRLEQLFKKGKVFQIQLIYILLSIAVGSSVADFFINFSNWSKQLPYFFQ